MKRPTDSIVSSQFTTLTKQQSRVASEDEYGNPLSEGDDQMVQKGIIYDLTKLSKLCDHIAKTQFHEL